jgi:DnaJ-class molecular chaperone
LKYHPDKVKIEEREAAEQKFAKIQASYEKILKHRQRKAEQDERLKRAHEMKEERMRRQQERARNPPSRPNAGQQRAKS